MVNEEDFIFSLRSISIHLIKHVQPLQKVVVPVVAAYESGQWMKFSNEQKLKYVDVIVENLDGLVKYYEEYPHQWSKERFAQFKQELGAYHAQLKA